MPPKPPLSWSDIRLCPGAPAISGALGPGEILGFAGLDGQGQERCLEVLAGLARPASGVVSLRGGAPLRNYRHAARAGIAYLPRDRRSTGILPALSVLDNFGLPSMDRFSRAGLLRRRAQRERLHHFTEFLAISHPGPEAPITALSGGNQQKVLLARCLALEPSVLLLDDPTRGVDLGTRLKFYDAFRELRDRDGLSMIVLSSEIEEILAVCDRVLVFRGNGIERELSGDEMTTARVLAAMFGEEAA